MKPDILKISIDGVFLEEDSHKNILDKKITDIIGCDYKTFYQLLAISFVNYVAFLNLSKNERRTFIENILDIELFSEMQKIAKEDLKELKKKISEQEIHFNTKKTYIYRDKERLVKSINENKQAIETLKNDIIRLTDIEIPKFNDKKILDISNLEKEISFLTNQSNKDEQDKLNQQIRDNEIVLQDLQDQLENLSFNEGEYKNLNDKLRDDNTTLNNMIQSHAKMQLDLNILTQNGKKIKEQLDNLSTSSTCPMCKNKLSDDSLKTHLTIERENLLSSYKIKRDSILSYETLLEKHKENLNILKNDIDAYSQRKNTIQNLKQQITNITNSISILKEKDLDSIKDNAIHVLKERLSVLCAKDYLYEINLNIDMKKKTLGEYQSKGFDDLENSIKKDEEELLALGQVLDTLNIDLNHKNVVISALEDKGIKANIIDMYIPFLNERINYYLDKLNLFLYFEMDKNFDEVLKKDYRLECSYENLSIGQRKRVDLSIMFAFRDIAKAKNYASFNVLFLDDMLDHIDDDGIENIFDFIKNDHQDIITIVIDHNFNKYQGFFDKVLTFTMKNNFTHLESEND
jgi:DNA repair exonuclease SbcCD ATPase subunit